jgi:hypothetical protein
METIEQKWQRLKAERAERVNVKSDDLPLTYKELKGDTCVVLCPPRSEIKILMTGAVMARQNRHGDIILEYSDGTREKANCPEIDLCAAPDWLAVVGAVQGKRTNNLEEWPSPFNCPRGYGECEAAQGCVYPSRCH